MSDDAPISRRRRSVDPAPSRTVGVPTDGAPTVLPPAVGRPRRGDRTPGGPRRLGLPVPATVTTGVGGRPSTIDGDPVEAVRETWLVEDRWWTDDPLRRRYWEVVTERGKNLIVFRDLACGTWACQR